jgi:hypothetical protein
MSNKFVDNVTPICADWLNQVDQLVYEVFDEAATDQEARDAINVPEEAPQDGFGYARIDKDWQRVIDLDEMVWQTLYLGAFPTAPTTSANGEALVPGMVYYDTEYCVGRVWTGLFWRPLTVSVYGNLYDSYVIQADNLSLLTLTDPDGRGNGFALYEGSVVNVYLDGARLVPYSAVDGLGSFTIIQPTSQISFQTAVTGLLMVEQVRPISSLVVNLANRWPIAFVESPDGARLQFTIQDTNGNNLNIGADQHVEIFVDGHQQQPGVDFQANGSLLTFTEAPLATSNLWGIWIDDDGDATT